MWIEIGGSNLGCEAYTIDRYARIPGVRGVGEEGGKIYRLS